MRTVSAKAQTFKTKLTSKLLVISAMPLGCSLALLYFALDAAKKFAPTDPARIPFVGVPMLLAATLAAAVILLAHHFLHREVIIEDDFLIYKDAKTELHLEISKMAYSPPSERGLFKMLMFSDGETFVQLPALFMDSRAFAQLHDTLASRRRKARTAHNTYSL